ncbi:ankyrin repeat-containing domain protein [Hypomontagnella monticulosa]|nr:ankyrin repeat-containing domain protein [Hypomontagnella monticulosa]
MEWVVRRLKWRQKQEDEASFCYKGKLIGRMKRRGKFTTASTDPGHEGSTPSGVRYSIPTPPTALTSPSSPAQDPLPPDQSTELLLASVLRCELKYLSTEYSQLNDIRTEPILVNEVGLAAGGTPHGATSDEDTEMVSGGFGVTGPLGFRVLGRPHEQWPDPDTPVADVIEDRQSEPEHNAAQPDFPHSNAAQEIPDNHEFTVTCSDGNQIGGNTGQPEEVIRDGSSIDVPDSNHENLFEPAAWDRNYNSIDAVVQAGSDPTDISGRYRATMDLAAHRGDVNMIRIFLHNGARLADFPSSLTVAAQYQHHEVVKLFLDHGADPNSKNSGYTALHSAAEHGNLSIARLLIAYGAAIDPRDDQSQRTPLHLAAEAGHLHIVDYLITMGANVNARGNPAAGSVLHAARRGGHSAVVKYLVGKPADIYIS